MIAALLLTAAAVVPDLSICADRPGKSSQTCIVPTGHVQVEIGIGDWTLTKNRGERDTSLAVGQFAIKYGLSDRSHIEVDVTPWQRVVASRSGSLRDSQSGFGDLLLVYKHLLTPTGAPLQLAASPFVKVPTAKQTRGNRRWEGGVVVPIQYAIPKSTLAITLAPELDWVADGDRHGHHALMANVVNLGWQATPALNLSAEIWRQWDWDPSGTGRQVSGDVAVAYFTSKRVQVDGGANIGLNRATPDLELNAGLSILF